MSAMEPVPTTRRSRGDEFASSFDRDPAGYAAGRPGYPPALFEALEERCGLGEGSEVVEIGPGTGQATAELLRRGAHVLAIEPGPALARHLLAEHAGEPLEVSVSTFEDVTLGEGVADLVVAATSFHWVEATIALPKIMSVLRPGGFIALWWNLFYDPDQPDEFSRTIDPLFTEYGNRESPAAVDARQAEYWLPLLRDAGFEDLTPELFPWEVEHRTDDLVALFSTFSSMRVRPPAEREQLLARIGAAVDDQFGGHVRRRYHAALYTGRAPTAP
jgi:SAM-dependent methyltransferase